MRGGLGRRGGLAVLCGASRPGHGRGRPRADSTDVERCRRPLLGAVRHGPHTRQAAAQIASSTVHASPGRDQDVQLSHGASGITQDPRSAARAGPDGQQPDSSHRPDPPQRCPGTPVTVQQMPPSTAPSTRHSDDPLHPETAGTQRLCVLGDRASVRIRLPAPVADDPTPARGRPTVGPAAGPTTTAVSHAPRPAAMPLTDSRMHTLTDRTDSIGYPHTGLPHGEGLTPHRRQTPPPTGQAAPENQPDHRPGQAIAVPLSNQRLRA